MLYKPDNDNRQLWLNFSGGKSEYKITKTGITTTTFDKNKNELKQIEFSTITDDMRPFIHAIGKLQKDKNAETDVRMDIDVKEYQKLRGLSPKSYNKTKKLKKVSLLLNAWFTVQVNITEGDKTIKKV
jgi:RecA-family ATPase